MKKPTEKERRLMDHVQRVCGGTGPGAMKVIVAMGGPAFPRDETPDQGTEEKGGTQEQNKAGEDCQDRL